jgi:chemotaxis-related protein WspB
MLFLLFQLNKEYYALEAGQVREVLPLVGMKEIPHSPSGVAGIFNYRGTPVPAIDLSDLTLGRPAQRLLSTRIILVNYAGPGGEKHLLGLIAEKATETLRREPDEFKTSGVTNRDTPYLGPVATDTRGFIQWIKVDQLLPATVRDLLFKQPVESS